MRPITTVVAPRVNEDQLVQLEAFRLHLPQPAGVTSTKYLTRACDTSRPVAGRFLLPARDFRRRVESEVCTEVHQGMPRAAELVITVSEGDNYRCS